MPVVPISPRGPGPQQTVFQPVPPPDAYSLMAAVQMHSEGRLVKPFDESAWSKFPESTHIEDRRNWDPRNPDVSAWTEEAQLRREMDLDKTSKPYGRYSQPMSAD